MEIRVCSVRAAIVAVVLAGMAAFAPGEAAAQLEPLLTLGDSGIRVIRGTSAYSVGAGFVLRQDDLLHLGPGKSAQFEIGQNVIVAAGPDTRLYLAVLGEGAQRRVRMVMLTGWVKVQLAKPEPGRTVEVATPLMAVALETGTAVVHAGAETAEVFLESAPARAYPIDGAGKAGAQVDVAREHFASRAPNEAIQVAARPSRDFLQAIPPAFRDALPAARAKVKADSSRGLSTRADIAYADVAGWLNASQAVRLGFVPRFRPKIQDAEFRRSLDADMRLHPEWNPILHPPPPPPPPEDADGRPRPPGANPSPPNESTTR